MSAACPKHDTGGGPCYCPGSVYAEAANTPVIGCKRIDGGAACIVPASGCAACSNAIFEQVAAPTASPCGTCHHACDCREQKFHALYDSVNAMMLPLGAQGEITTRHPAVDAVMNALHDIDGGVADDSREHKIAVLIKAALDAAVHLDDMKNGVVGVSKSPDDDQQRQDRSGQVVERVYAACEVLGVDIGKHEVAA